MKKFKEAVYNNLIGKRIIFLFVLTNIVYALMLLVTIPRLMQYSKGLQILDMMPTGYNAQYIKALFESLGENGRKVYLFHQLPVDMFYPLLYGVSYCLIIAYLLKKLDKFNSAYFYLCLLPLAAGLADYAENIVIIMMLNQYPDLSTISMSLSNYFTIIKSMTTSIYFVILIIMLIVMGVKKLNKRKLGFNT